MQIADLVVVGFETSATPGVQRVDVTSSSYLQFLFSFEFINWYRFVRFRR